MVNSKTPRGLERRVGVWGCPGADRGLSGGRVETVPDSRHPFWVPSGAPGVPRAFLGWLFWVFRGPRGCDFGFQNDTKMEPGVWERFFVDFGNVFLTLRS